MLERFIRGYIEAAFFTSGGLTGTLADETRNYIRETCEDFWNAHHELIGDNPERAGSDFHLTRNRHGAGFWDGDWPGDAATILTNAAHVYGTCELVEGDDGKIYHHG